MKYFHVKQIVFQWLQQTKGKFYSLIYLHGKTKDIHQIFHQHILRVKEIYLSSFLTVSQNRRRDESTSAIPGISLAIIAFSKAFASSGVSITVL